LRSGAAPSITGAVPVDDRAAPSGTQASGRGWAPFAAGALAWLVLCAPVLLPGMQLGDRDTSRLYYPVKKFVAEGLRRGELRFWDPFAEGGVSLLGQVTPGLLHPFTLLYFLPFDLAFALNHLLALFLGGLGVYWLARTVGASRWPALAGALVFGGSGALVSAASSNLPFALGPATVPLAIAGLFWFTNVPTPKRLLVAAALLAMCAFAGDPQSFGFAILIGAAWVFARERLRGLKRAALWALCGLLLSAPVALPGAFQLTRSPRSGGASAREVASFATAPVRLFGLVVPHAFDQQEPADGKANDTFVEYLSPTSWAAFLSSILLGAPAILFAFAAGRRAAFSLCAAAVLLAAATGDTWGLHSALGAIVPGWKYFRFAEKLALPASWLLAVAAAMGVERVLAGEGRKLRIAAGALLAVSLVGALAVLAAQGPLSQALRSVGRSHDPDLPVEMLGLLSRGLLETACLCALVLAGAVVRRLFVPLAVLACTAPALLDPMLVPLDARLYEGRSGTGEKALQLAGPSAGRWRLWVDADGPLYTPGERSMEPHAARLLAGREALFPQLQALDGIEGLAPYFSAPDARFSAALRGAHEQIFSLFGVRLQPSREGQGQPQSESGYFLHEFPPQPRAFVVHEARATPQLAEAVSALRGIDVHRQALVDAPWAAGFREPEGAATVRLERPSADALAAYVRAATPGLLVIAERFDPGWSTLVDGARAEVVEIDLSAIGVRVPAGEHRVELRFVPKGLPVGLAIALATAALLFALWARQRISMGGAASRGSPSISP
jgi:hypothetical protein